MLRKRQEELKERKVSEECMKSNKTKKYLNRSIGVVGAEDQW